MAGGIFGDGQRGGIFGAKVDPRLLQMALEQRAEAERQRQGQARIAGAFDAAGGMQEPSRALYEAKHQRAMDVLGNRPPEGPGFRDAVASIASLGPRAWGGAQKMWQAAPMAAEALYNDPLGSINSAGMAGQAATDAIVQGMVRPFMQFGNPNVDPVENAADLTMSVMGGSSVVPAEANSLRMGIKAYHASPHKFDRFESRPGTGEGSNMLGPGTYVAENPSVSGRGGSYDRLFTRRNMGQQDTTPQQEYILNRLGEGASDLDILKGLAQRGGTDFEQAQAMLDKVKAAKAHIYELDIAADPEHFLDWDKPLSEQPEKVRQAYAKAVADGDPTLTELLDGSPESFGMMGLFTKSSGAQAYNSLAAGREYGSEAAKRLREAGIPGIRYLDQGSRGMATYDVGSPRADFGPYTPFRNRADAEAHQAMLKRQGFDDAEIKERAEKQTSNFVVFPGNEHLIAILKKYGLPISAAGLAALSQLHPQEAQAAQRKPSK